jgi:hypothetical protein
MLFIAIDQWDSIERYAVGMTWNISEIFQLKASSDKHENVM